MSDMSNTPDLTETEVIIIGCVCAAILIALLIVLVCIIIRRRKLAKQLPPQTPPNVASNGHAPPQKPPRGLDNTDDYQRNGYLAPSPRPNGNLPHHANKSNYFNEKQGDLSFSGSPRSPTKDKQFLDMSDERLEYNNGQESGYNTQDNPKPKKVIYEVVV